MKSFFSILFLTTTLAFAGERPIDLKKSELAWTGTKVVGSHTGKLKFKSGTMKFDDNKLVGGSFVVDMNSMTNTDLEGEWQQKLLAHLKNDDFFSVQKFKTAKLDLTEVKRKSGNLFSFKGKLTIKGISKNVGFDGTLSDVNNKLTVKGRFQFDRTDYGIKYKSGKFFEGLGDKLIHDNVTVAFEVVSRTGMISKKQ